MKKSAVSVIKRKRKIFKIKKGSSTVEAAYLIPMLMLLVAFLIYLSFFLYNRFIVTEAAYICALRGSRLEYGTAKECYSEAGKALADLLNGRLPAMEQCETKTEVTGAKVGITIRIKQKLPFWDKELEYSVEKSAVRLNPYRFIRDWRRVKNVRADL